VDAPDADVDASHDAPKDSLLSGDGGTGDSGTGDGPEDATLPPPDVMECDTPLACSDDCVEGLTFPLPSCTPSGECQCRECQPGTTDDKLCAALCNGLGNCGEGNCNCIVL
jgi:hypothetical protein